MEPELRCAFDGTKQSAHKAIRGNLEAMLAVFHGHVDEGDMLVFPYTTLFRSDRKSVV